MDLVYYFTLLGFICTSELIKLGCNDATQHNNIMLVSAQGSDFRFSTIYGDHMVLQQAPNQANVWGYTSDCEDKVIIKFNQNDYPATMLVRKDTKLT